MKRIEQFTVHTDEPVFLLIFGLMESTKLINILKLKGNIMTNIFKQIREKTIGFA